MSETETPQPQDYGVLERGDGHVTLRLTRRFAHPLQRVWRALTEAEHLAAWFPTTIEGDFATGAALKFAFREVHVPPIDGRVLACEPPALLEFVWGDDETLRFELAAHGPGTLLTFTATFAELGRAARDAAGWHVCLDHLARDLDGRPAPSRSDDGWRQVNAEYVQLFGPEAATIGPPKEWEDTHGPASQGSR